MATEPQAEKTSSESSGGVFSLVKGSISLFWVMVGILPTIIFNWGAAKLNWSINQSNFWAIVAFFFSGFYYPYYAFFQAPTGFISSAAAAVGARRRR